MLVTYTPDGGDQQRWEFEPLKLKASEAELIEKRYGDRYSVWLDQARAGQVKARRVLLWHLLRRTHHTLRFEDTPDFTLAELTVEHSLDELREVRQRVLATDVEPEMRDAVLASLDADIAKAEQAGAGPSGVADDVASRDAEDAASDEGKASASSSTSTG